MRYFVYTDEQQQVTSVMMTQELTQEYILSNKLIEVSSDDYSRIEQLMPKHDVVIESDGSLKAYQRLEQGSDIACKQLDQYATSIISKGIKYKNFVFKLSVYDQMNIRNRVLTGGKYKTASGDVVDLDIQQATELCILMTKFIDQVLEVLWSTKPRILVAESLEDINQIVTVCKSMLDTLQVDNQQDSPQDIPIKSSLVAF